MAKDKAEKAVLEYLMAQNRPYSLNDLIQSAQLKEYGKSATQKSLDQLVVVQYFKICVGTFVYNK